MSHTRLIVYMRASLRNATEMTDRTAIITIFNRLLQAQNCVHGERQCNRAVIRAVIDGWCVHLTVTGAIVAGSNSSCSRQSRVKEN